MNIASLLLYTEKHFFARKKTLLIRVFFQFICIIFHLKIFNDLFYADRT